MFKRGLVIFVLIMGNVLAATITVNPGDSIQNAINFASNGDTVLVKAGTYDGDININKQ